MLKNFSSQELKINTERQERLSNAEQSLTGYANLSSGEKTLLLIDDITDLESLEIFKETIKKIGADFEEIDLRDSAVDREKIQQLLEECKLIIKLAQSSHESLEGIFDEDLVNNNARMLNLFDIKPEVFNNDGPMAENVSVLESRMNRMENELNKAVGFKITSSYGTDLTVGLRAFKERTWFKCSGKVEAGRWDNWPSGEVYTTPDEENVNGVLVLPVLNSDIVNEQGVDEFVRVNIKNGLITSIEGGESARILREQLQKNMQTELDEGGNPQNVLRIAELAFGANEKARSAVINPEASYDSETISTVETEKRLGTIHLAFGSAKHGEEGSDGFEDANSHYDFVIPRNGLTVEMFTDEEDFKKLKNGRKFISDGGLNYQ